MIVSTNEIGMGHLVHHTYPCTVNTLTSQATNTGLHLSRAQDANLCHHCRIGGIQRNRLLQRGQRLCTVTQRLARETQAVPQLRKRKRKRVTLPAFGVGRGVKVR